MNPEYRRGPGAYRCGCGVRVDVTIPPPRPSGRCWYQGCTTVAVTKAPLSFCREHEKDAALHLAHVIADRKLWLEAGEWYRPLDSYAPTGDPEADSWVYFMRRESLIKIGYSSNPTRRAVALNAVVLAKERGGPAREAAMHGKFRDLRVRPRSEWFLPGDPLIAYINALRAQDSAPPLDA